MNAVSVSVAEDLDFDMLGVLDDLPAIGDEDGATHAIGLIANSG